MSKAIDTIVGLRPLELHYFRIPRERWELILARVRQMGANAVSTIVPWMWHEPQPGVFDLTGFTHPTRNVADFLETCAAMGFQMILRTSPYAGAGLLGGGVPSWLLREHPEVLALGPDSQPRRDPASGGSLPSREHPTYLKYVERWYRELTGVLATRQWPDGPVVALRVDRPGSSDSESQAEAIPTHWDYNPHVVKVQWPVWLRQQYDGIDTLNAAWGTAYSSFSDAAFPSQSTPSEPSPGLVDAAHFVAYTITRATETYARMLHEMGWVVPIASDPGELPVTAASSKDRSLVPAHAVQVDPEPPQVGTSVRWAMNAPLRGDGSPQRQFWAVKATLLGMEQGVKQIKGGSLVTGSESRRVRLHRPGGDYGIYRMLLDGQLLAAPSRKRGDTLYLDYLAADDAGETDMYLLLEDRSAQLPSFLQEYLASLLMSRACALQQAGSMCQALVETFSNAEPAAGEAPWPAVEDLQTAERGLAEARLAAQQAAASLGRLERLASEVRGEIPATSPTLPTSSAFTPQELGRLIHVRKACAQAAPGLAEAARSITALCQNGESLGEGLTIQAYRAAFEQTQAAAREAEATLADTLGALRADLAGGALSSAARPLQDWLTRIVQGLAAALVDFQDAPYDGVSID